MHRTLTSVPQTPLKKDRARRWHDSCRPPARVPTSTELCPGRARGLEHSTSADPNEAPGHRDSASLPMENSGPAPPVKQSDSHGDPSRSAWTLP